MPALNTNSGRHCEALLADHALGNLPPKIAGEQLVAGAGIFHGFAATHATPRLIIRLDARFLLRCNKISAKKRRSHVEAPF